MSEDIDDLDLEDVDALVADVQKAETPGRTKMDRYREFRQLFLGSDQGRRVLLDIMDLCRYGKISAVRGDPHWTYFRDGMRNAAHLVLTTIQREPREQPGRQQSTKEE